MLVLGGTLPVTRLPGLDTDEPMTVILAEYDVPPALPSSPNSGQLCLPRTLSVSIRILVAR
jgi:hypothetical protein